MPTTEEQKRKLEKYKIQQQTKINDTYHANDNLNNEIVTKKNTSKVLGSAITSQPSTAQTTIDKTLVPHPSTYQDVLYDNVEAAGDDSGCCGGCC